MYSLFPDTFHFLPFKSSSVLTIFHEIVENECKRECVSRIAKTLLYYTNNHIFDESVGAKDCDDIVEFIRRATSPETAETYMTKMANNSASASTPRSKRKLTAFTKMTIEPILVELQALLSIPRLRSAIRLVQHMDATPKISPEDKRQGWFQLLDFFHQKGMLLDEEKNANFHSLTVGSETGLNSILQFFQGIVNGIMDDIGDAMEKRGSAITDEEEDWIRLHQLKVRQTVLKFCMRRAAFSSNPLTVACSVSGLECKEDAYFDGSPQKEAVSKKMDDILSFRIEPRDRPLCLGGPIREDEVGLIENQHEAEAQIDEAEETERQAIAAEKYSRNQWEEIVPASPANVPFMAINVDDTDIEEDEEVEDEEARNETFDIVVESDEKSTGEGGAEILSDTDNGEVQETGEDIAKDDEESINSEDNEDQDIVEIDSDSNEDQPLNEQPYSNNYVHSSDEDQQADQHIDDSGKQYDGVDRFRQEDDDSDGSEEFYDGVDRSRQEDDYSYSDGSQEFHDGIDRSRQEDVYSDGSQEFHDGIDRSRQEDDDNDGSQQDRIVARRPRQEDDGYSDQSEEGRIDARRSRQEDIYSDQSEQDRIVARRSRQEDDYSDGSEEYDANHHGRTERRIEICEEIDERSDRSEQYDANHHGRTERRIAIGEEVDESSDRSEQYDANHHGRTERRIAIGEEIDESSDRSEQYDANQHSRTERRIEIGEEVDEHSDRSEQYDANHHGRTERRIEIGEEVDEHSDRSEQYDANQHGRTERRIAIGEEIDERSDRSEQYDANQHGRTERRIQIGEEVDEHSDRSEQYDGDTAEHDYDRNLDESYIDESGGNTDDEADSVIEVIDSCEDERDDESTAEEMSPQDANQSSDAFNGSNDIVAEGNHRADEDQNVEESNRLDSEHVDASNETIQKSNNTRPEVESMESISKETNDECANSVVMEDIEDAEHIQFEDRADTNRFAEEIELGRPKNHEAASDFVDTVDDAETQTDNKIRDQDGEEVEAEDETDFKDASSDEAKSDDLEVADDAETQIDQNNYEDKDIEEKEEVEIGPIQATSEAVKVAGESEVDVQTDDRSVGDRDAAEKEETASVKDTRPNEAALDVIEVANYSQAESDHSIDENIDDTETDDKLEDSIVGEHAGDNSSDDAASGDTGVASDVEAETDDRTQDPVVEKEDAASIKNTSPDYIADDVEAETDDRTQDPVVEKEEAASIKNTSPDYVADDVEAETDDRTQDPFIKKEDAASIKDTSPDYVADDVEAETDDRTQDPVAEKEDAASIKHTSPDYVADDVEAETDDRTQDPVVEKEEYPGGASPDETASDAMDASDDMEAQTDDKTDWDREIEEVEEKDVNSYDAASNAMDVSSDIEAQTNDRTDGNRGIENVEIEDSFKGTNPDQSASDVLEVVDDAGAEPDDRTDRNTDVEENNETNVEADSKSEVFDTDSEATEEKEVNISVDQQHLNGVAVEPIIDEATSELDADLTGDAEIPPEEHAEENDKPSKIDNIGEILIGNKAEMTGTLSLQEAPSEHEHPDEAEAEDDAKSNEGGEEDAGGASLVDSGGASDDKTTEGGDDYSTYTFNELRKACKSKGISAQGKAVALRERLKKAAEAPSPDDQEVPVNALPEVGFEEAKDEDDYSTTSFRELRTPVQGKIDELRERLRENDGISSKVPPEDADADDVEDDLSTASYRELQQECKRRGLNAGGKRGDLVSRLNGGKMQGSIAGDVSHAIKEEDSEENSSVEEVLTKEQEFARICSQAAEKEIKKKSIPRAIKIQEPVVQNEPMTSPIASMLKAAGNFVAKGLDMMSPTKRKRKAEVIDLLDSDNDEAKEETNADELSPLRNPVPKNITAGAVFSPGDQSVISTLSAADHNNLEAPRRTRPGVKRKMGGRPPILKRQKVEEGEKIRSDATELPKRKTRSNSAVSSIRSTRSKRSGTSAKKTASNSAASSVRSTRSATRSQTGAKKK
jgi:hypothetical protein